MRYLALLLVLAFAMPTYGQVKAGPVGTYAIVTLTITFNPDGTVTFQQVAPTLVLISPPGPTPGPSPIPSDLRSKLTAEISVATDRVATAATLKQALTATVAAAKAGTVTKEQVSMVLSMLGPTMPTWTGFLTVLNEAIKTTDLAVSLQIAVEVLGTVK
jgi:hypothetical protein